MARRQTVTSAGVSAFAAIGLLADGWGAASAQTSPPQPSLSQRDVQVVARALGFLQPPPAGDALVAVVFAPGDAAGRQDAERIAALFGAGVRVDAAMLRARPVPADALRAGGYAALIAAVGAPGDALMAAARAQRIACVTSAIEQVEAGHCTLWVRSEPRVQIVVSRAATQASGLGLAAAFRMMVREI